MNVIEEKSMCKDLVCRCQLKKLKKKYQKIKFFIFPRHYNESAKIWGKNGCVILQPYDLEVGAGTFHPATTLRS